MLKKLTKIVRLIDREAINLNALRNRSRIMTSYIRRRPRIRGFPIILHLEVTNKCNLKCKMCPRLHMKRDLGFMDFSLFRRIIDQARGKIDYVELYLFGEPLLHPQICEMIRYCKAAGMYVALSTNGIPLNESISRSLIDSHIDFLTISLDGITAATYSRIRGSINYGKVLSNVETFLRNRTSASPRHVVVQLIEMQDNAREIKRFTDYWTNRGIQVHLKPLMTWTGDVDAINMLSPYKSNTNAGSVLPCDRLWRHLSVFWDGTVVPCHYIYDKQFVLGDLNRQTISDVWGGSDFVEFRSRHIADARAAITCCSKCKVRSLHGWELLAASLVNTYTLRTINTVLHYN